jgi:hypothetical protein
MKTIHGKLDLPHRSRGFVECEFLIVIVVLAILLNVGIWLSDLLKLRGFYGLIPPAGLWGALVGWAVIRSVLENRRIKKGSEVDHERH